MIKLSIYNPDTIKRPKRSIIAATLAVIYLMISLSPLAGLSMHSKTVAHALTGECTGDCASCGCSVERMATRTCCCSRKIQQQAHVHEDGSGGKPDCCKKAPAKKKIVIASCGLPCGSGKHIALSGGGISEVLPFHFSEQFTIPHSDTVFTDPAHRLAYRHDAPPDPPPRISIRS